MATTVTTLLERPTDRQTIGRTKDKRTVVVPTKERGGILLMMAVTVPLWLSATRGNIYIMFLHCHELLLLLLHTSLAKGQ